MKGKPEKKLRERGVRVVGLDIEALSDTLRKGCGRTAWRLCRRAYESGTSPALVVELFGETTAYGGINQSGEAFRRVVESLNSSPQRGK